MEEKERIEIIGKSLLLIILTIVISIFAWFFYGVTQVSAATWYSVYNKSTGSELTGSNTNQLYKTYGCLLGQCVNPDNFNKLELDVKIDGEFKSGKTYNFEIYFSMATRVGTEPISRDWGTTATVKANTRTGTTLTVANRSWAKTYYNCPNTSNYDCYAMYRLAGQVTLTSNLNSLVFLFGNDTDISLGNEIKYYNITYQIYSESDYSDIINNANENAQNIINSQNENADKIIQSFEEIMEENQQNQNSLFQQQNNLFESFYNGTLESQQVCETLTIDKNNIETDNKYLGTNGQLINNNDFGITDYIEVEKMEITNSFNGEAAICFYNEEKTVIQCSKLRDLGTGIITLPNGTKYTRISIYKNINLPTVNIISCKNGNQALMDGPGWNEEDPDSTPEDDLEDSEEELMDYLVDPDELEDLEFEVDTTTNGVIWGIFDDIVTGNELYFTSFISILFLGLVKLILAR